MFGSDKSTSRIIGDYILWLLRLSDKETPYYDDTEIEVGDNEAVRPFFAAALRERCKWYLLAIFATGVVTLLSLEAAVNSMQVWGLLLDLVGESIL